MRYESPLHALKAYRLTRPQRPGSERNPNSLVGVPEGALAEPLSGAGATHSLRADVPLCRYDLLGTCNVRGCTQQHARSYLASVPALCSTQDAATAAATLERAALALVEAASAALAPAPLAELRLAMRLEVTFFNHGSFNVPRLAARRHTGMTREGQRIGRLMCYLTLRVASPPRLLLAVAALRRVPAHNR
jgi:hypothetical protein